MDKIDHATINYDDAGARVRTYFQNIQTDDYYVHDEDGDPKAGLPAGISLTEVDNRVSPSTTSTSTLRHLRPGEKVCGECNQPVHGGVSDAVMAEHVMAQHEPRRGRFINANEATSVYLGERRDV